MEKQNSPWVIRLARHNPLMKGFVPVTIYLTDLDTRVRVSIVDGFDVDAAGPEDVAMHSESLAFIFKMDFGYDTLTVNGRFEATPEGFSRMTRSFALGSLNGIGLTLSPKLILRADVVWELLKLLGKVKGRLVAGTGGTATQNVSMSVREGSGGPDRCSSAHHDVQDVGEMEPCYSSEALAELTRPGITTSLLSRGSLGGGTDREGPT